MESKDRHDHCEFCEDVRSTMVGLVRSEHRLPRILGPARSCEAPPRVLFVDDEPMLLDAFRGVLERKGYAIEIAQDPLLALEKFRAAPETFDIVVSDQIMPGLDGCGLRAAVAEINPDLPFVLMSGDTEHLTIDQTNTWVLTKPFRISELLATLTRALER